MRLRFPPEIVSAWQVDTLTPVSGDDPERLLARSRAGDLAITFTTETPKPEVGSWYVLYQRSYGAEPYHVFLPNDVYEALVVEEHVREPL